MACQSESKFGVERRETLQEKPYLKGKPERKNLLIFDGRDTLKSQTCLIRILRDTCRSVEEANKLK